MGGGLKLDQRKGDKSVFLNPCFLKDRDNVLVISASVMVISISGMTRLLLFQLMLIKSVHLDKTWADATSGSGKATRTSELRED